MKKLEKAFKNLTLILIKFFLPRISRSNSQRDWKKFKQVLVFRLDNRLGNSILILSLVQSIKRSLPRCKIDILITSKFGDIYKNHPDINQVIGYDQTYLLRFPLRFIKLIRILRKNNYDAVFSSSNPDSLSVSQAIFSRLLKSRYSIGFDCQNSKDIYSDVVKGNVARHYSEAQVDLWRYFDRNARFDFPKIYFVNVKHLKPLHDILFWLGATGQKVLEFKLIERLLTIFNKLDLEITLAAGPSDASLLKSYASNFRQKVVFLAGDLTESAVFFRGFKLICTPDTGPMHLVAALGIPVVQVFVNSNKIWYGYKGENKFLIERDINESELIKFIQRYTDT
jgi:heptosyltransferase-3